MRIVVPKTIADPNIVSYNLLPEDDSGYTAYSPTTYYIAGDHCTYGHKIYVAMNGEDVTNIPEWAGTVGEDTTDYIPDQRVKVTSVKKIYKSLRGALASDFPEWDSAIWYSPGDKVSHPTLKKVYKARLGENPENYAEWVATYIGPDPFTQELAQLDKTYAIGDYVKVTSNSKVYKCIKASDANNSNANKFPPDNLTGIAPFWSEVGTINLGFPPDTSIMYEEWEGTETELTPKAYVVGDKVKLTKYSSVFECLIANTDNYPMDNLAGASPKWKKILSFNEYRDMEENTLWTELDIINRDFYPPDNIYDEKEGNPAWVEDGLVNYGLLPENNLYGTDPAWSEVSSTNAWCMFDGAVSQSSYGKTFQENSQSTKIDFTITTSTAMNSIALFNLIASKVTFTLTTVPLDATKVNDSTFTVANNVVSLYKVGYDSQVTLDSGTKVKAAILTSTYANGVTTVTLDSPVIVSAISKVAVVTWFEDFKIINNNFDLWSEYFFSERTWTSRHLFKSFDPIIGGQLNVVIYSPSQCSCGLCVIGKAKEIGQTLVGVKNTITDYSKKSTNDYGVTSLSVGAYAKDISLTMDIPNGEIDALYEWMAHVRAIPLVFISDNSQRLEGLQYQSLLVYGFYADFSVTIPAATYSTCAFEIKGLI